MLHGLKKFLEHKAYKMRVASLQMTTQAGSGHPTSALSAADIVAALFFYSMRFDPDTMQNSYNDHFILSKGHAAPILYAAWKELGKLTADELLTYRRFGSPLEGHPTARLEYVEASTGSLGIGLSIGVGKALADRLDKRENYTYVLMGDSELTEGSIWEAAEIAAYYKLSHLVGIVDCNRLGQSTETIHGWHAQRYAQKFEAFGWKTLVIDGHDMQQIVGALDKARTYQDHPTMIIAKTIKGYGVDRVENKEGFHGKAFSQKELEEILPQMEQRFASAAANGYSYAWHPNMPTKQNEIQKNERITIHPTTYKKGEQIATRMAYGQALMQLGAASKAVVALDAEVKNSTFAELFEQKYPERFFQCFVAEQNMISMGVGFAKSNKLPFISTFACFLTRAHDQIRMAAIDQSALKISGSHAGVSIGQDGPSQMGLEDIAMMRAIPESIVLYPCDAQSTQALMEQMAHYDKGISYIRTTREKTPVIYDAHERFEIGGCKVLHSSDADNVLIIGAGITLHEALKARAQLLQEGVSASVIDLYSIKPLDITTIEKVAQTSSKKIITVEDHYLEGGLGQSIVYALANKGFEIHCLAVTQLPMSGKPEELLKWADIDAAAIIAKAKQMMGV
ncbi:MAG: transketolase [Candidatus Babeliales bacterium]